MGCQKSYDKASSHSPPAVASALILCLPIQEDDFSPVLLTTQQSSQVTAYGSVFEEFLQPVQSSIPFRTMLASTRVCASVSNRFLGAKCLVARSAVPKTHTKPKRLLIASVRSQQLHTSATISKKFRSLEPIKPPEPEIALDGDIVPQSRLNDILAHLGEDHNVPIFQETQMELEPFAVNEVLDVGRHTKILPGTSVLTSRNIFPSSMLLLRIFSACLLCFPIAKKLLRRLWQLFSSL